MNNDIGPLWKRTWKTLGIRYLGKDKTGHIDHMDRFEHAFELGFKAGIKHCEDIVDRIGLELKKDVDAIGDMQ